MEVRHGVPNRIRTGVAAVKELQDGRQMDVYRTSINPLNY